MSSAILYLAIIAIWAGVLIPRWLKRDSARSAAAATVLESAPPADAAPADAVPTDGDADPATVPAAEGRRAGPPATPASREESRARVLKARRRLLWMLLSLTAGGGVLALTGLAAWWVITPPIVMLAGYLLLLREAAKADAEASQREREALEARQAAMARARERAKRAKARRARDLDATRPAVAGTAPVSYAAAPVPADYDDEGPGRDFTLGHRYVAQADDEEDAYDQYAENRLRAVGD
jgi:hypothetical protein